MGARRRTSEFFAPELERMRILSMHGSWYRPVEAGVPHLVLAKVAGYDRAVYGLPETVHPLLVELPDYPVLLAASKRATSSPGACRLPLEGALGAHSRMACRGPGGDHFDVDAGGAGDGRPEHAAPEGAEAEAFTRSVRFFREQALFSIDHKKGGDRGLRVTDRPQGPADAAHLDPCGFASPKRVCCSPSTGRSKDPSSKALATQILDYAWSEDFYHADPSDPATVWSTGTSGPVFYGDDNARVLLATMTASRLLNEDRWDGNGCSRACWRTCGQRGRWAFGVRASNSSTLRRQAAAGAFSAARRSSTMRRTSRRTCGPAICGVMRSRATKTSLPAPKAPSV